MRIKTSKRIIIGVLLAVSAFALAAEFDVDHACFRANDEIDVLEVYLLIPRNAFKFVPAEEEFQSTALVRVALAQNDTVVVMDEWTFRDQVADTTKDISHQRIPDISILQANPGVYTLIALVADVNTGKQFKIEKQIVLPEYSGSQLDISDIHICAQLSKTAQENKFSKYFGYDMIPNASAIFGPTHPMIYGFCEVYNLDLEGSDGSYQVRYSIEDMNGETKNSLDWKTKAKPGASAVELNGINIVALESGIYNFKVDIKDDATGNTINKSKRFYVMKETDPNKLQLMMEKAVLAEYTDEEIDKIFGPMKYIASELEKRQFKKSDREGKIRIIANFWKTRDTDPSTELNESKIEFDQRLRYCNEHFYTARKEGWESDMGRVLIIYGFPSEVERFPSSLETKPYQIWHYYEIEGGIDFVFIDKSGFGTMELVHSTGRNELQDPQWRRFIEPTSALGSIVY